MMVWRLEKDLILCSEETKISPGERSEWALGGDKRNLHRLKVPMCKEEKSEEIGGEKSEVTPHFLLNMC